MTRVVLHIDMDAFFAAIEERDNPRFRGQPIVVGADPMQGQGRGVVSTANYEARKYGIRSALPISEAFRLCPTAVFLPVDGKRYARVSQSVMGILRNYAEKMEQVSVDEANLEVNPKSPRLRQAKRGGQILNPKQIQNLNFTNYKYTERIARQIKGQIKKEENLTCSIGIGPNKLVAKIASGHEKPDGLTIVRPHEVQAFLNPKPVDVLPGVGPKTRAVLENKWGIKTVADLRKRTKEELVDTFGKNGIWLWQIARGLDDRPIEEEREIKSVGQQTTFDKDRNDSRIIVKTIFELLEETFRELKDRGLEGKTLTVVVRYTGFETHTSQKKLEHSLVLRDAKRLCLKLLLPYLGRGRKIRLVGIRISSF